VQCVTGWLILSQVYPSLYVALAFLLACDLTFDSLPCFARNGTMQVKADSASLEDIQLSTVGGNGSCLSFDEERLLDGDFW
jgi:hypothetical protein